MSNRYLGIASDGQLPKLGAALINAGLLKTGDDFTCSYDVISGRAQVMGMEIPARAVTKGIPAVIEFMQNARAEIALALRLANLKADPVPIASANAREDMFEREDRLYREARINLGNSATSFDLRCEVEEMMAKQEAIEPPPAVYGAATIDQWGQPRIGDWIRTFRGKKFHPLDIKPEDIDIDDIAHALSLVNRFTGHTQTAYSVAEHSVRVMWCVQDLVVSVFAVRSGRELWRFMLEALLHDASEAYLADIARPIKMLPEMEPYRKLEKGVEKAISAKYGLPFPMSPIVKRADEILLCTEARDLMTLGTLDWILREAPLSGTINPWSADLAEHRFHQEYRLLMDRLDLKV